MNGQKKLGVVIPVLNNFVGALSALESLETKHIWEPRIIPQWRQNKPLSQAWNEGIEYFLNKDYDYVLVINDDILFCPFTIDNLIQEFENVMLYV